MKSGVISLITTIIIGLLLSVITTSAIAIVVSEQRQAIDSELSTRAYYAAEAGVENGLIKIKRAIQNKTAIPNQSSCAPITIDSTAKVTCQLISAHANDLETSQKAEQATELDLSGVTFNRLVIAWNQKSDITTSVTDPQISLGTIVPAAFPPINGWDVNKLPAIMEVFISSYSNGTFNSADVASHYRELLFKPTINNSAVVPGYTATSPNVAQPLIAFCNPNVVVGDYNCRAEITNFDSGSRNYILRFKPRYNRAHLKVQVFNGSSLVADVPTQYVTVDVTARANDVFRRVATKVIIGASNTGAGVNLLDYVVFSDETICKDFRISRANQAQTGANDGCVSH